jgi:hypothetical protein
MVVPESIELSADWLDLWGPSAYETGLYYMAIHFIRFLPFMRKRSEGFALQAWLLAHVFLDKIDLKSSPPS